MFARVAHHLPACQWLLLVALASAATPAGTGAAPAPAAPSPAEPALVAAAPVAAAPADGPIAAAEAERLFRVAEGLEVRLFAAEPLVEQPVTMTFDDRGRLWVIQYLQYPAPAGLKPVAVDQYLRTRYDRVPEPPPKGPRGADRITILEDSDGDGRADRTKDFVTGLNLASGLALGHGGVYVAQAPYLLFYPDRDGDDVPEGDPEVLLSGFGMEDAHAVVNSLVWGPDGWLYGAQGSTVTADIRGIGFQQGVWRYHPRTRAFELFAEGGGNTWGVDFDRHGNVLAGTNFGHAVLLHQVQGGYYVKGFAKHGPLHHPYAYGYFEHAMHEGFRGGHVTCGGIVYESDLLGERFRGAYIAANLLSNAVYWHTVEPARSTVRTRHAGELLATDDAWFRPVDCLAGPDGAVWIADWCDQRANHVIPQDTWHRASGRIWRVQPKGHKPTPIGDLARLSSAELVGLLGSSNDWQVRQARRLLAERRDSDAWPALRSLVEQGNNPRLALEALWALYSSGGWDEAYGIGLLSHSSADVRAWAVRLLGDKRSVSKSTLQRLVELAKREPDAALRSQLASSARRLARTSDGSSDEPPGAATLTPLLRVAAALATHSEDRDDPFIPLLLWWAVEAEAVGEREAVVTLFTSEEMKTLPLVGETLLPRLVRRYAALAGEARYADVGYEACARLLAAATGDDRRRVLWTALAEECAPRRLERVPEALEGPLSGYWEAGDESATRQDPERLRVALRLGSRQAFELALARAADPRQPDAARTRLIEAVAQQAPAGAGQQAVIEMLLERLSTSEPDAVRQQALAGLGRFGDERIAERLLAAYGAFAPALRSRTLGLLAGRRAWAALLLAAVERGQIAPADLSLDVLRRIVQLDDAELTAQVERRWGRVRPATPGEKQALIVVLARELAGGQGDAVRGQALFVRQCAACHTLHGAGGKIGPDLTGADRHNQGLLLLNIVDPSNSIRPEYVAQTVTTHDGRVLTGLVVEESSESLVLVDAKNERTRVPLADIDERRASTQSLMPEKLLDALTPAELRDLFAYLSAGP